jgi:hypothetical protein
MADAWGNSWGGAWALSWAAGTVIATPPSGGLVLVLPSAPRRRATRSDVEVPRRFRRDETEDTEHQKFLEQLQREDEEISVIISVLRCW